MIKLSWVIWDWKSHKLLLRKKNLSYCFVKSWETAWGRRLLSFPNIFELFTVCKPVTLHGLFHANVQSLFQSCWAPGCVTASWEGVLEPKQENHSSFCWFYIFCLSLDAPLLQWSNGESTEQRSIYHLNAPHWFACLYFAPSYLSALYPSVK